MNADEIIQMDAEQLRIEIARAKGWKYILSQSFPALNPPYREIRSILSPEGWEQEKNNPYWVQKELPWTSTTQMTNGIKYQIHQNIPDWPNDIAAAYALEAELTPDQRTRYIERLTALLTEDDVQIFISSIKINPFTDWDGWRYAFVLAHATPEQRCRAYLLALMDGG